MKKRDCFIDLKPTLGPSLLCMFVVSSFLTEISFHSTFFNSCYDVFPTLFFFKPQRLYYVSHNTHITGHSYTIGAMGNCREQEFWTQVGTDCWGAPQSCCTAATRSSATLLPNPERCRSKGARPTCSRQRCICHSLKCLIYILNDTLHPNYTTHLFSSTSCGT